MCFFSLKENRKKNQNFVHLHVFFFVFFLSFELCAKPCAENNTEGHDEVDGIKRKMTIVAFRRCRSHAEQRNTAHSSGRQKRTLDKHANFSVGEQLKPIYANQHEESVRGER